jgi:predicted kinase
MGNNRYKFLSIHKYSRKGFEREKVEKYQESLLQEMRRVVREDICNFIVLELEGCKMMWFNKFVHVAITLGQFKCHIIEMAQPREICLKYNRNQRSFNDVAEAIDDMTKCNTPSKMIMLDPTFLLDPSLKVFTPVDVKPANSTIDLATNLAQLLQDKNVMQLLQSQLTQPKPLMAESYPPPTQQQNQQPQLQQNQQPQQQNFRNNQQQNEFNTALPSFPNRNKENFQSNFKLPLESCFEELPVFAPKKIVDYKHCHMPTFEETLMEFRVFRVLDYKHQTNAELREYIQDIDVDKIIEKRKSVALRKKILEYLKSAERPEDTVSNPKYPRNWEAIAPTSRAVLKNKRKKKMTPKIRRVLAQIAEKNWMMGYKEAGELEAISSDDEMVVSEEPKEVAPIIKEENSKPNLALKIPDPFKDTPKTIPNFNRSNHPNVRNIRDFLWLPGRLNRPPKILIILRGAAGSGKSHLTQLIKRKETEMGGDLKIISINRYFEVDNEDEEDRDPNSVSQMTEIYLQQMVKMLKKPETTNFYNLIVIDAENCDLSSYSQFYQAGSAMGFAMFTIELHQDIEICQQQNVNKKSLTEIRRETAKLENSRTPAGHTLLNATELYVEYNCLVNPKLQNENSKKGEEPMDQSIPSPLQEKPSEVRVVFEECPKLEGTPNFNWHAHEAIIDIRQILEEPGRSKRSSKIVVILRGPSGGGKTHLSGLIRNKELTMGNGEGFLALSIDDFFINPMTHQFQYNLNDVEKNLSSMMKCLKEEMRKETRNFIVVDAENGSLVDYKQFHEMGSHFGYTCYTIELYQDEELCMRNNVHNRSLRDIESVLDEMKLNQIPADHVLINPSYLYVTSPVKSEDTRPLKSALKVSAITSFDESSAANIETKSCEKEFLSRLKQPLMVRGEIVNKNLKPPAKLPEFNWHNRESVDIRDILEEPGRSFRPEKIVIVLRGVPGSGKTFLAWLIERKEIEKRNRAQFKLLTIDKYFETEEQREIVDVKGVTRRESFRKYDYDASKLGSYMSELVKELKEITQGGHQKFIIVDADCCDLLFYNQFFEIAQSNGYAGYAIELNQDQEICLKYNDHKRDQSEIIEKVRIMENVQTPASHTLLDPEYLYGEYTYELEKPSRDEEKVNVSDIGSDEEFGDEDEVAEAAFGPLKKSPTTSSKWDDDADGSDVVIDRLDGTKNKTFERLTIAEYLQNDDEWTMRSSKSGKKRVRWADIEEKKNQERMRDIGFIVGQTDWKRMTDTSDGKSALEKTKYIEPRKK